MAFAEPPLGGRHRFSPQRQHRRDPRRLAGRKTGPHNVEIRGKPPGLPLTPEEFAEREPLWNALVLAKIEETEGYEARKVARRELRRAGRQRPYPPPPVRPPASPVSVPADPFLARGGCRGPEFALSLRQRPQVQEVLRGVMAKGGNRQGAIRAGHIQNSRTAPRTQTPRIP